jgi:hypothetical protein
MPGDCLTIKFTSSVKPAKNCDKVKDYCHPVQDNQVIQSQYISNGDGSYYAKTKKDAEPGVFQENNEVSRNEDARAVFKVSFSTLDGKRVARFRVLDGRYQWAGRKFQQYITNNRYIYATSGGNTCGSGMFDVKRGFESKQLWSNSPMNHNYGHAWPKNMQHASFKYKTPTVMHDSYKGVFLVANMNKPAARGKHEIETWQYTVI